MLTSGVLSDVAHQTGLLMGRKLEVGSDKNTYALIPPCMPLSED